MLNFTDSVSIDTSGPYRMLQLSDGLYVVGQGYMIPVNSVQEAQETIQEMSK